MILRPFLLTFGSLNQHSIMSTEIKLPSLGENIESGDVLSIHGQTGDVFTGSQPVLSVKPDKADPDCSADSRLCC